MDREPAGNSVRGTGMALALACATVLAGCDENGALSFGQPGAEVESGDGRSVRLVERDVEAPEVFQKTDMGLWDGRPSLGGVWVAHPDVTEPERVIIRNTSNGNFVIGALFRRERDLPGPAFQVSSDAAEALGMLAGAPMQLNVTALRREEAPAEATPAEEAPVAEGAEPIATPADVETSTLDPVAGAAAAIEAAEVAEAAAAPAEAASAEPPAPTPQAPARPASQLDKPFIQVGIFSVEQNARNTATALRQAGMVPTVLAQSSQGKDFWRVVVGPATTAADRAAVLKTIKSIGFADAYAVSN